MAILILVILSQLTYINCLPNNVAIFTLGNPAQTFYVSDDSRSWQASRDFCVGISGDLAHQPSDLSALANYIKNEIKPSTGVNFWMGGSDLATTQEWRWVNGKDININKWTQGHPMPGQNPEDCLSMNPNAVNGGKSLLDAKCESNYPCICQIN